SGPPDDWNGRNCARGVGIMQSILGGMALVESQRRSEAYWASQRREGQAEEHMAPDRSGRESRRVQRFVALLRARVLREAPANAAAAVGMGAVELGSLGSGEALVRRVTLAGGATSAGRLGSRRKRIEHVELA